MSRHALTVLALVAVAAPAAPCRAGGYSFAEVARTGTGLGASSFDSIGSASLAADGLVAFEASAADVSRIFRYDGPALGGAATVTRIGGDLTFAIVPAINDAGDIAFIGAHALTEPPSVLRFDPDAAVNPVSTVVDGEVLGVAAMASVSITNRTPDLADVRIGFWSYAPPGEGASMECVRVSDVDGVIAFAHCGIFPEEIPLFPALNDLGSLAYVLATFPDGVLDVSLLVGFAGGDPVVTPLTGLLSRPSINDQHDVVAYAADDEHAAGIYAVNAQTPQDVELLVPLEGVSRLRPAEGTRPEIADGSGDVAFVARVQTQVALVEAVLVRRADSGAVRPVISVGDGLLGGTLAGELELFGINAGGQVLFSGRLDGGQTVLVLASP